MLKREKKAVLSTETIVLGQSAQRRVRGARVALVGIVYVLNYFDNRRRVACLAPYSVALSLGNKLAQTIAIVNVATASANV